MVREPSQCSRLISTCVLPPTGHCPRLDRLCGLLKVQEAAGRLAARMKEEPNGTQAAVDAFHRCVKPLLVVTENNAVKSAHRVRPAGLTNAIFTVCVSTTSLEKLPGRCKAAGSVCVLFRHLQGRLLPSQFCKQQGPLSVEAASETRRPMNGFALHPAAMNGCDSTGAPHEASHHCSEPGKLSAHFCSVDEHKKDTEQRRVPMAGQGAEGPFEGNASVKSSRGGASRGGVESAISAKHAESMKYLQKKPLPWLTGWWEVSAAFLAVFLLPLISVVPFSTTTERPNSRPWVP